MKERRALAVAAMLALAWVLPFGAGSVAADSPAVSLDSWVLGQFYPSGLLDNAFSANPTTTPTFSQLYSVLNFNPHYGFVPPLISCTPDISVTEGTRPLTDVIPLDNGSCATQVAQGNGYQAGIGPLYAFNAIFTGELTVSAPGQVTFSFYSDDGYILGLAPPIAHGSQPSYVSGPMVDAPAATALMRYPVVSADNETRVSTETDAVVSFPAAGTYPFEIDYFESHGGPLALTVFANGAPIPSLTSGATNSSERARSLAMAAAMCGASHNALSVPCAVFLRRTIQAWASPTPAF